MSVWFFGYVALGALAGFFAGLLGVGGGSLSVPFMTWCNVKVHQAIGTSAAIGFPIAAAGTIGYMIAGYGADGLSAGSAGFIYLPALAGTVAASMLVATVKKIFAGVLILLSAKMLHGLFWA